MKKAQLIAWSILLVFVLSLFSGCRNETGKESSAAASSKAASEETSVDASSEEGDSSADSSAPVSVGTSSQGTRSAAVSSFPKAAGTTSTKRLPEFAYKLKSGTINVLAATDSFNTGLNKDRIAAFKTMTGTQLTFKTEVVEWNSLPTVLAAKVMAGNAPDYFDIGYETAAFLIRKNYFEPIEKYVNMNDALMEGIKNVQNYGRHKDVQYAVVGSVSNPYGFLYSTELMEEAELEDPVALYKKGQWNWNKFLEYVKELTVDANSDGTPEVYGVSVAGHHWTDFVASTGQDFITFSSSGEIKNNLRSSALVRVYDLVKKVGDVSNDPAPWEQVANLINKRVAMIATGFHTTNTDIGAQRKAGKLSWVPIPKDPNASKYYTYATSTCFMVPKGAKNPEATAAWLYFQQYLALNPNKKVEEAEQKYMLDNWGISAADREFYKAYNKAVTPIMICGDRIPDFTEKETLWYKAATTPWSQLVEKVYPSLQAAIDKQNKS